MPWTKASILVYTALSALLLLYLLLLDENVILYNSSRRVLTPAEIEVPVADNRVFVLERGLPPELIVSTLSHENC